MWFQSNSAGNCLFIFISRVFLSFFLFLSLFVAFVLKNLCYLIKSNFFSLLSLLYRICSMGSKSRWCCCSDFRREQYILISLGSTFSIPLRLKCLDVRSTNSLLDEGGVKMVGFAEAYLILLQWREAKPLHKSLSLNEHGLCAWLNQKCTEYSFITISLESVWST